MPVDRRTYLRVAQFLETARYAGSSRFRGSPSAFCSSSSALAQGGAAPARPPRPRRRLSRSKAVGAVVFACGSAPSEISGHRDARFGGIDSWPISGTTFTVAITSPLLTDCPACLAEHVGDDARDLGLDQHLVARFDLARGHHELFERVQFGLYDRVDDLHRTGFAATGTRRLPVKALRRAAPAKIFRNFFIVCLCIDI